MNDLLERFFELESRQRTIAAGAALVLVFGAYWYFVLLRPSRRDAVGDGEDRRPPGAARLEAEARRQHRPAPGDRA